MIKFEGENFKDTTSDVARAGWIGMKTSAGARAFGEGNVVENLPVPLLPGQMQVLRKNYALVESKSGITSLIFYQNLFRLEPSLRSMFHSSIELQGRKLMEALSYTIDALEQPRRLIPVLESLGRRHITYGVKPEHYPIVLSALLSALKEVLKEDFTADAQNAWEAALKFVSAVMQRGAASGVPQMQP